MNVSEALSPALPGFYYHEGVAPECRPFAWLDGNPEVVVFVHGLTGSPHDFAVFAQAYRDAHYDVVTPLLPGHGSHISRLERLSFRELYIPFEPLFDYLASRYTKIHLVGLSYGAIFTTKLALAHPVATMTYLAPAFFLSASSEKNMRLVQSFQLHRYKSRIAKTTLTNKNFRPHPFTYAHIPFLPASELHAQAQLLLTQLPGVDWPVFHAHGDADDTTPIHENSSFLRQAIRDYTFYPIQSAPHVLPLSAGAATLAKVHLAWLQEHAR